MGQFQSQPAICLENADLSVSIFDLALPLFMNAAWTLCALVFTCQLYLTGLFLLLFVLGHFFVYNTALKVYLL